MVDIEKRYHIKSWTPKNNVDLPSIKPVTRERPVHLLSSKQEHSNFLPSITNSNSSESKFINSSIVTSTEALHEAAKRFILRNNMVRFSQDSPSYQAYDNYLQKRTTPYSHVQAKIDTGLPRLKSKKQTEPKLYQVEPKRSVNWIALKSEIEHDTSIRTHASQMRFGSDHMLKSQLAMLGNLVRLKVKSHLSSKTGSGDERYKIVAHLTVFPSSTSGLHVSSRCLWNARTDNSITMKMQGIDCNILIVVFLCYTEIGKKPLN